jgi:hypothetical protein
MRFMFFPARFARRFQLEWAMAAIETSRKAANGTVTPEYLRMFGASHYLRFNNAL